MIKTYNICISRSSFRVHIERDGKFKLHGNETFLCKCPSIRRQNIKMYVRSRLPSYMRACIIDLAEVEFYLNTEINFKCKFGTKTIRIGKLYMLSNLKQITDREFLDWVIYFDPDYETAYEQYSLFKLPGNADFLIELIEKRFTLKKSVKPLEGIKLYLRNPQDWENMYVNTEGIVTKDKSDDSKYVLIITQFVFDNNTSNMIDKIPVVNVGDKFPLDKIKSINFLIDWYVNNSKNTKYAGSIPFICRDLFNRDFKVIKKFIDSI
jgi:hypothetical protein